MINFKSEHLRRLLLVLDLASSTLLFMLVVRAWVHWRGMPYDMFWQHLTLLPIYLLLLAMALSHAMAGQTLRMMSLWQQWRALAIAASLAMAGLVLFVFVFKLKFTSRLVLGGFLIGDILLLAALRAFVAWYYFKGRVERRDNYLKLLIVGTGQRAAQLRERLLDQSEFGVEVVGYLDPDPDWVDKANLDAPLLGTVTEISKVLQDQVVDEVAVALPRSRLNDIQSIVDACEEEGVRLKFMADFYDLDVARVRLDTVSGLPVLAFEPVAQDEGKLIVKRFFDLTVTLLAMPVLLPLLGLVALAVRLDSPGPVLFVQQRVGLHKRRFGMIKFRSMYQDAEARLKEIEHLNEADGPNFKIKDDPRVTRVGAFIRRTSIDELPQLFNVILGHMSLVGPRPMSVRDVDLFDRGIQRKRFSVRPGLTCIWQVSGRSDLSFEKWLELDLEYIDRWSLALDLSILFRTIPAVLRGSGAV